MEPLCIVSDFDGTLAARDHMLGNDVARLIMNVLQRGWHFVLLTGRHVANVQERFLKPLLSLPSIDVPQVRQRLRVFTCEGATAWRVTSSGSMQQVHSSKPNLHFSPSEKCRLECLLSQHLRPILQQASLSLTEGPEWWEDALLVFKVSGDLSRRGAVASRLETLLSVGEPIRVGVAGKTTIVVARKQVSKRGALAEIVSTFSTRACCVYLADEFVPPGNDSDTVDLDDVVKISVDEDQTSLPPTVQSAGGSGPEAARQWLSKLLAADTTDITQARDLIHCVTAGLDRAPCYARALCS